MISLAPVGIDFIPVLVMIPIAAEESQNIESPAQHKPKLIFDFEIVH